jgi:hypothetical protein
MTKTAAVEAKTSSWFVSLVDKDTVTLEKIINITVTTNDGTVDCDFGRGIVTIIGMSWKKAPIIAMVRRASVSMNGKTWKGCRSKARIICAVPPVRNQHCLHLHSRRSRTCWIGFGFFFLPYISSLLSGFVQERVRKIILEKNSDLIWRVLWAVR